MSLAQVTTAVARVNADWDHYNVLICTPYPRDVNSTKFVINHMTAIHCNEGSAVHEIIFSLKFIGFILQFSIQPNVPLGHFISMDLS